MKCDMGGAAAVLGAAWSLMMMQPTGVQVGRRVVKLVAAVMYARVLFFWRDDEWFGEC
jgi:leucyl aminopeptidase